MPDLKNSIRVTLTYFSLFDYPLTTFEIHKWLHGSSVSLAEVRQSVSEMIEVAKQDGFFFLSGHSEAVLALRSSKNEAVERRLQTHFDNQEKLRLARRAARLVSWLPGWQLIAITNTVAAEMARPGSDIDWLVVVKSGRLWTTRFFLTLWLAILGQWRHGTRVADKICLSFFLTNEALDLSKLKLSGGDIYLTYWPTQIIPLLSSDGAWEGFLEKNNWLKQDLPNFDFDYLVSDCRSLALNPVARRLKIFLERILSGRLGDRLEKLLRALQLTKMSRRERGRLVNNNNSGVVISDQMLKFHEIDRRAEFHHQWQNFINGKTF